MLLPVATAAWHCRASDWHSLGLPQRCLASRVSGKYWQLWPLSLRVCQRPLRWLERLLCMTVRSGNVPLPMVVAIVCRHEEH